LIGKIYSIITPYYDLRTGRNAFKSRPALILSDIRNNDYTVLPISTVSRQENRDTEYDIAIDITVYPNLNLRRNCFVRTHKQTTVHRAELGAEISDLKGSYPELFEEILQHLNQFNSELFNRAME